MISEASRVRLGGYRLYIERATGRMRAPQDGLSTAIVTADQAHGKLVVTEGAQAGRELMLFERIASVGRTDENDVTLADTSVSRHHARLLRGSWTKHVAFLMPPTLRASRALNSRHFQRRARSSSTVKRLTSWVSQT
jgi:hypothetical protein